MQQEMLKTRKKIDLNSALGKQIINWADPILKLQGVELASYYIKQSIRDYLADVHLESKKTNFKRSYKKGVPRQTFCMPIEYTEIIPGTYRWRKPISTESLKDIKNYLKEPNHIKTSVSKMLSTRPMDFYISIDRKFQKYKLDWQRLNERIFSLLVWMHIDKTLHNEDTKSFQFIDDDYYNDIINRVNKIFAVHNRNVLTDEDEVVHYQPWYKKIFGIKDVIRKKKCGSIEEHIFRSVTGSCKCNHCQQLISINKNYSNPTVYSLMIESIYKLGLYEGFANIPIEYWRESMEFPPFIEESTG